MSRAQARPSWTSALGALSLVLWPPLSNGSPATGAWTTRSELRLGWRWARRMWRSYMGPQVWVEGEGKMVVHVH